jgi:6-pyruvoyl-tetrahydropterin synthase
MTWVYHSEQRFRAHHALTLYNGEPEAPHGHEWRVSVKVSAETLRKEHFALDFHAVHDALAQVMEGLDGTDLTDHAHIGRISPTAAAVALFVQERLEPLLTALGGRLEMVSVWEGPETRVDLRL